MNTQLTERPTSRTQAAARTNVADIRPRPVWTDHEEAAQPSPPFRRRGRWIALFAALVVAGAATGVVLTVTGDGSTPDPAPTQRPAFDSPGGNSLTITARGQGATGPAFDSPGGNSLTIDSRGQGPAHPAFDSPGGNSLTIDSRGQGPTHPAFDSPGGNSLTIPSQTEAVATASAPSGHDSPGGNSLTSPQTETATASAPSGHDSPGGNSLTSLGAKDRSQG